MNQIQLPRDIHDELQLRAILEILRAVTAALPLEEILTVIANMAIIVFDATSSFFLLDEGERLRVVVARGELAGVIYGSEYDPAAAPGLVPSGDPVILQPGEIAASRPLIGSLAGAGRPIVLLPLQAGGRRLGVLGAVVTRESALDISFLVMLSKQAATAVENARLREENREWRGRLDAVFACMAEPVLVFDRESCLVLMNGAADEIFGARGVKLGDKLPQLADQAGITTATGAALAPEGAAVARALKGERVQNQEERLIGPDGEARYYLVGAAPLISSLRIEGAVAVWRDITERKQAELFRAEYATLISHDLRSPLTTVMGQAQWLLRKLEAQRLERESSSAAAILRSARQMQAMIQDIVESAQLESGHLELHKVPVDLLGLIAQVVEHTGSPEDRARIQVDVPEWVRPVNADPERLERVVANLLSNALKYSPAGSPVSVQVVPADHEAVIAVVDQGAGIAPEETPFLFQSFYRSRSGRKAGGLGLGLYIARMIVEAHGGRIWVESAQGQGSTFRFSLPAGDA